MIVSLVPKSEFRVKSEKEIFCWAAKKKEFRMQKLTSHAVQ